MSSRQAPNTSKTKPERQIVQQHISTTSGRDERKSAKDNGNNVGSARREDSAQRRAQDVEGLKDYVGV
jgi:hypothetical protein